MHVLLHKAVELMFVLTEMVFPHVHGVFFLQKARVFIGFPNTHLSLLLNFGRSNGPAGCGVVLR